MPEIAAPATSAAPSTNTTATEPTNKTAPGAPPDKTPVAPAPEFKKEFRFKIDGKEVSRRFNSEEELEVFLQKGEAANKRFEDAAKMRAQIEKLIASGKDNLPETIKKLFGVNVEEWAEKHFAEKWNRAALSEDERKALEQKEETERYKRKVEEYEAEKKTAAQRAYEDKVWQETERDIMQALQDSGLPKNHNTLNLISSVALDALNHGVELTPKQMVTEARHRASEYAKTTLLSLKGTQLIEALGTEVVNEVIRAEVTRRRAGATGAPAGQVQPPPAPPAPSRQSRKDAADRANRTEKEEEQPRMSSSKRRTQWRFGMVD
jgi:hypothetical protein